jgi:predicted CopG family antitoxin
MPRAGEGRSIRIDPEVYDALLLRKHGNATFSDVIASLMKEPEPIVEVIQDGT